MRQINHLLCESSSGKSAVLKIEIDDRFGRKVVNFSTVSGWRKELALKYLSIESKEWNNDVVRVYVGLQVLKCARDKVEAIKFINILKSLSNMEVHFWSSKFLINKRTKRAWRSLYV